MWLHKSLHTIGGFILAFLVLLDIGFLYFSPFGSYQIFADIFLIACLAIFFYARFVERWWPRVRTVTLASSAIDKPFRIVLLTDLHLGNKKDGPWMERIVKKVTALQPDLVLIGGDLTNNQNPTHDETAGLVPLAKLKQFPIFYVLGNHEYGYGKLGQQFFPDHSESVIARMTTLGIPLLRNTLTHLHIKEQPLQIFGGDDVWAQKLHFTELASARPTVPLLFLTHNPDAIMQWPVAAPKPFLTLAGHSHAGQIALFGYPLGNATMRLGRHFYHGLREYKTMPIYISAGLGESTLPLRLGARPEISVIEVTPS